MANSSTVRPFAWRWSRRVASFVGRSLLALVSGLVLAYGTFQLTVILMKALIPLAPSPLPSLPIGEMIHVAANYPAVQLVGPVMVDPVLNPTSLLTVGVTVGLLFLGTLGVTIAGTAPQLRQRTSAARESGLSAALPSIHDVFLHHKSRAEILHDTGMFSMQAVVLVSVGWASAEILIPNIADGVGVVALVLVKVSVRLIPVAAFICATVAVLHAVWYAGLRWRETRRVAGGESR
jgi:hypothetical protein